MDESSDICDVGVALRHKKAKEALEIYQTQIAETTETHSQLLQTLGDLVLDEAIPDSQLRQGHCQLNEMVLKKLPLACRLSCI